MFTSSIKVGFAPETCQDIPGRSEVIVHRNGKNREFQKSLLIRTGRTGKLRSHFLSLCMQIFVFSVFKFFREPGSCCALIITYISWICLKLVKWFCCYSASTNTSFGFCSSSELLQLKFGNKKIARKWKLLGLQDSYKGDEGCKWKIFTISTTLWKDFFVNFHVL